MRDTYMIQYHLEDRHTRKISIMPTQRQLHKMIISNRPITRHHTPDDIYDQQNTLKQQ
jgi:hypothetical protein